MALKLPLSSFRCDSGSLSLQTIRVDPKGAEMKQVTVVCNGKSVNASIRMNQSTAVIQLDAPVRIATGQELVVTLK